MKNTPVPNQIVQEKIKESGLSSVGGASIREIKKLVDTIEQASDIELFAWKWAFPASHRQKLALMHKLQPYKKALQPNT